MSKEYLEAFKIVYNNFDYLISDVVIENDDVNICLKTIKEQLPTIKQALHRLEYIDNANPSEALECLESIKDALWDDDFHYQRHSKLLDTIEQALLKAQESKQYVDELKLVEKKLKALEIIKEKRVNVGTFIHLTKILKKDYEQCKALNNTFGANICDTEKEFLTEEEFNLLKEVLE